MIRCKFKHCMHHLLKRVQADSEKARTTSQVKTLSGSPLISASKVYPAGRLAGAVTCTISGGESPSFSVKGAEDATFAMVRILLYSGFSSMRFDVGKHGEKKLLHQSTAPVSRRPPLARTGGLLFHKKPSALYTSLAMKNSKTREAELTVGLRAVRDHNTVGLLVYGVRPRTGRT